MKVKIILLFGILIILLDSFIVYGHGAKPNPAHQYIVNESKYVWVLIPSEIKNQIKNPINTDINDWDYDNGDDIIDGSGEEDITGGAPFLWHYWDADNPEEGKYDDGVRFFGSSYGRAKNHWKDAISYYLKGDVNKSYYTLGRIAHLLQDASVPAHMHNDEHALGDQYEKFVADINKTFPDTQNKNNFYHFKGPDYPNQYYRYENLTTFTQSQWEEINPRLKEASYQSNLFKLFWYTAQKTQYFVRDDVNNKFEVVDL